MKNDNIKRQKGLTLIEVVVSLAIIGIIAMVFLTIFSTGNINIFKANKSTRDIYKIQEQIDIKIRKIESKKSFEKAPSTNQNDIVISVDTDYKVEVKEKTNGSFIKSISGNLITVERNGLKINTFIPDE